MYTEVLVFSLVVAIVSALQKKWSWFGGAIVLVFLSAVAVVYRFLGGI